MYCTDKQLAELLKQRTTRCLWVEKAREGRYLLMRQERGEQSLVEAVCATEDEAYGRLTGIVRALGAKPLSACDTLEDRLPRWASGLGYPLVGYVHIVCDLLTYMQEHDGNLPEDECLEGS